MRRDTPQLLVIFGLGKNTVAHARDRRQGSIAGNIYALNNYQHSYERDGEAAILILGSHDDLDQQVLGFSCKR